MTAPWLSVILPTWNGEAYLARALESVAEQESRDFEVIAVDDGSTDRTPEILRSYARRLPLRILERGRVGNWVANTNRGIALAEGTYLCFLHQDDWWLRGRLRALREATDGRPDVSLVVHASEYVDARGRLMGKYRPPLPHRRDGLPPDFVVPRFLVQNFITIPSALFPRRAVVDSGGLDERLWYTADWDLWLRLAVLGRTVALNRVLAAYRIHPLSQTSLRSFDDREFRVQHEIVLDRHLAAWAAARPGGNCPAEPAARFSIDVNVALAALANRRVPAIRSLLADALRLGTLGCLRYWTVSRIAERVSARLRCRLWSPPASTGAIIS
jgi:glycosyltransferase involved in cell wall biosynthesis